MASRAIRSPPASRLIARRPSSRRAAPARSTWSRPTPRAQHRGNRTAIGCLRRRSRSTEPASQRYVRSLVLRDSSLTVRPDGARPRGAAPSASRPSPCPCGTASRRRRPGSDGSTAVVVNPVVVRPTSVDDSSNDVPSSGPSETSVRPIGCASVNSMRPATPGRRKPRSKSMGASSLGDQLSC